MTKIEVKDKKTKINVYCKMQACAHNTDENCGLKYIIINEHKCQGFEVESNE